MAAMIPSVFDFRTRSRGEREVFERLRDDQSTETWTVLHSLDIAEPQGRLAAEVDFVLLIPGHGVLVLEVKATGRLRRDKSGIWYYGDDVKGDSHGPFKQASAAMHNVRRTVVQKHPELSSVVFWSAVLFPYLHFEVSSPEWHSWQVIDRRGFTSGLAAACRQVLVSARRHVETTASARWFDPTSVRPTGSDCRQLAATLRPEFELFESVRSRASNRAAELKHFTDEQFVALDALAGNPRVLFEGPAGTGKTVLAMETVRRACALGRRTLLLCYNRLLGSWLSAELASEPLATASTLHALMLKVADRAVSDSDGDRRAFWESELPEAAAMALMEQSDNIQPFDELVVDEAQDVMFPQYLDLLDLLVTGGLSTGRWRLFGDFEHQAIFGEARPALNIVTKRVPSVARYELRVNCRNVPRIATLTCILGGLNPPYKRVLRPDTGIEPELRYHHDEAQQVKDLRSAITQVRREGFRENDILVLSPKAKGAAAERLRLESPTLNLNPIVGPIRRTAAYTTVQAYKGLEAPCVILTDVDDFAGDASQALLYTALTRAQDRLIVLASDRCRRQVVNRLTGMSQEVAN